MYSTFCISVKREIADWIEEQAKKVDLSRSKLVSKCIEQEMNKQKLEYDNRAIKDYMNRTIEGRQENEIVNINGS